MATNRSRNLSSDEIQAERNALIGVQSLPDYAPSNAAYSAARLAERGRAMEEARQAEVRAAQALAAARDAAQAAEWALHEGILGARASDRPVRPRLVGGAAAGAQAQVRVSPAGPARADRRAVGLCREPGQADKVRTTQDNRARAYPASFTFMLIRN